MKIQYGDDNISEEFYEETLNLKKNDPTKKLVSALWPEDVGFPLKLQFTQYVDLMIQDPEKFFEKLLKGKYDVSSIIAGIILIALIVFLVWRFYKRKNSGDDSSGKQEELIELKNE